MAKVLYTANAHVTGGRDGHGRTTDVDLLLGGDPIEAAAAAGPESAG